MPALWGRKRAQPRPGRPLAGPSRAGSLPTYPTSDPDLVGPFPAPLERATKTYPTNEKYSRRASRKNSFKGAPDLRIPPGTIDLRTKTVVEAWSVWAGEVTTQSTRLEVPPQAFLQRG